MAERFTPDQLGSIALRFMRDYVGDALALEERQQHPLSSNPGLQAETIEFYRRLAAEALAIAEAAIPFTQRCLAEMIAEEFARQRKERAASAARYCVPS